MCPSTPSGLVVSVSPQKMQWRFVTGANLQPLIQLPEETLVLLAILISLNHSSQEVAMGRPAEYIVLYLEF